MPKPVTSQVLAESRARIARAGRAARRSGDPAPVDAERAAYKALKLEAAITAAVAEWPPLPPDEISRLATLLRGGDAA